MARGSSGANTGWWVALGGVAVLTILGFEAVLSTRFSGGEGYPIYSTLRADPLGARALYEALDRLPGVHSERNFERLQKLDNAKGSTLMLLDVEARMFNEQGFLLNGQEVAQWAAGGGRVVITMHPPTSRDHGMFSDSVREVQEERDPKDEKAAKKKEDEKSDDDSANAKKESKKNEKSDDKKKKTLAEREPALAEALKVSADAREFMVTNKGGAALTLTREMPLTPADMPAWFSSVFLDDNPQQDWRNLAKTKDGKLKKKVDKQKAEPEDDDAELPPADEPEKISPWHLLAKRGDRAMILERKLGSGSIVICTDSYFASNEALWKNPKSKFLAWLIGGGRRVIFDETHLGANIGDEDSLMTLARRYRMHGLFIGGLLLFALYVWRSASSLVPPDPSQDLGHWRDDAVAGQSAAAGLEGLLRRGIGRQEIMERCFDTWEGTPSAAQMIPAERRTQARAVLAESKGPKLAATVYRKLRDILHPARR